MRVNICAVARGACVRLLSDLSVRNAAGRVVFAEKPPMVVVVVREFLEGLRFFFIILRFFAHNR